MTYKQIYDGEWTRPVTRGYRLACCGCGLVHNIDFRVLHVGKGHCLHLRPTVNNRATAAVRRGMKKGKR